MKVITLTSLLLLNVCFAQNANWAHQIKSEGFDECLDLAADQSGNVYVTGQIEFLAAFDDGFLLESAGIHDIFLAKFDSSGNRIWAKRAGARYGGEKGHSIAVDAASNVYICGELDDTSYFDNIQVIGHPANNTFVAKYDPNGNVVWVRHFETDSMNTRGYAISCDAQGNVYALGATQHNVIYNGNVLLTTRGDYDAFVFKFNTNGDFVWIQQIGGTDSDKAYGIAVTGDKLYVTGYFAGTSRFSTNTTLSGYGGTDFFLAKYDTSGNFIWARRGGDTGFDRGWDVTINTNGNIVCTGEFELQGQFGNNTVYANGHQDMFLTAYDSNGDNVWTIKGGGVEDDIGRGVSHDNNGNLFVAGDFADVASFGPAQVTSVGFSDVFLASYDDSGNSRFVKNYGGPDNDRGRGVGLDGIGNIYFCGEYVTTINFDGIQMNGDSLLDMFIVKISTHSPPPPPVCNSSATIMDDISCNGLCDGTLEVTATGQAPFTYLWSTNPPQGTPVLSGVCDGSYTVTVTDAVGCISTASITIQQPAALASTAVIDDATCIGCGDGAINLSVSGGIPPYHYLWSDGPTTQDRTHLHAGTYTVCINDDYGCQLCDTFLIQEPGAGVTAIASEYIRIFPNPASVVLKINLTEAADIQNCRLSLYDSQGNIVRDILTKSRYIELPVQSVSSGIYFLKLMNANSTVTIVPVVITQ